MSAEPNVTLAIADGVALVTIDRPKALNALNQATIAELQRVFEGLRDEPSARGVILHGAGDKAFVAGADITEIARATAVEAAGFTRAGQRLMDTIAGLGKPVIAAVNGFALGGGCELAMACTIRLAVESARFGQPEVKLGLIPGFGGSQRLPGLVGPGRALQLILTGETIDAREAYRIGLVNELVEPAQLLQRARAILAVIAANGPLAIRFAIEAVRQAGQLPLEAGLALEGALFSVCAASQDKTEGTTAFLEKRAPRFIGK